jgi:hypothetical protein
MGKCGTAILVVRRLDSLLCLSVCLSVCLSASSMGTCRTAILVVRQFDSLLLCLSVCLSLGANTHCTTIRPSDCLTSALSTSRCEYAQKIPACGSDDHLIRYLSLLYCTADGRMWLPLTLLCCFWMLLLFYAMSIVAEHFLCPAVEVTRACFACA